MKVTSKHQYSHKGNLEIFCKGNTVLFRKIQGKILGVGREEEYAGLCCCSSSVISGAKLKSGRRRRNMLYSDISHLSGNNFEKHAEEGTIQQV